MFFTCLFNSEIICGLVLLQPECNMNVIVMSVMSSTFDTHICDNK
jgi:hypothetical protein